jgi:hypothetical protein
VPQIIALRAYKPLNSQVAALSAIQRKEPRTIEICPLGIEVLEYEALALDSYYEDIEAQLRWFLENKVYACRNRLVKEWYTKVMSDKRIDTVPSNQDDFISYIYSQADYKNRSVREQSKDPDLRLR